MCVRSLCLLLYFVAVESTCPTNYTDVSGFCYKTSSATLDWHAAQDACLQDGGGLVVISSDAENTAYKNFRESQFQNGSPGWVGIYYVNTSGSWFWQYLVDKYSAGSGGIFGNYDNNNTIPIGHDGDCISAWPPNYLWRNANCSAPFTFVCEARPLNAGTNLVPSTTAENRTSNFLLSHWVKVSSDSRCVRADNRAEPLATSAVSCAVYCTHWGACTAFNHHTSDNRCEFVMADVNLTTLDVQAGWDVWVKYP
ncbi:C-type lectin 16-like [Physella acuta]|uniref:C-type lectin 16-like n=1 Tax=Physella acuta TaxID=109671 RepID=UPI0027DCFBA1|nr:C-type lectin 16-like [Physella acuta]